MVRVDGVRGNKESKKKRFIVSPLPSLFLSLFKIFHIGVLLRIAIDALSIVEAEEMDTRGSVANHRPISIPYATIAPSSKATRRAILNTGRGGPHLHVASLPSPSSSSKKSGGSSKRQQVAEFARKLVKAVVGRRSSNDASDQLRAGDILRDLPFLTQSSDVGYFSTHSSLCLEVFGFDHGEVLQFHAGAYVGCIATVVGSRGGQLWVLLEDEDCACSLATPPSDGEAVEDMKGVMRARFVSYYGISFLAYPTRRTTSLHHRDLAAVVDMGDTNRLSAHQLHFTQLCLHAVVEAERLYSAEQRQFLQRAPDLFVAVVAAKNQIDTTVLSGGSFYQQLAHGQSGAASHLVLLSPCVLVSGAAMGWAGEGDVVVQYGGKSFPGHAASLSSSVALSESIDV